MNYCEFNSIGQLRTRHFPHLLIVSMSGLTIEGAWELHHTLLAVKRVGARVKSHSKVRKRERNGRRNKR